MGSTTHYPLIKYTQEAGPIQEVGEAVVRSLLCIRNVMGIFLRFR